MIEAATRAAEAVIRSYEETQRLLPLAGGVPQPIGDCRDRAVVLALAFTAAQKASDYWRMRCKEMEEMEANQTYRKAYDHVDSVLNVVKEERDRLRDEAAGLKAESDLYRRGYDAIGACDISNYLALCKIAGDIGEPVLSDLWDRMKAERAYRERD